MTYKEMRRLIKAAEVLSGYFHADASGLIFECSEDTNFADSLSYLPIAAVREFEDALTAITDQDPFDPDEAYSLPE